MYSQSHVTVPFNRVLMASYSLQVARSRLMSLFQRFTYKTKGTSIFPVSNYLTDVTSDCNLLGANTYGLYFARVIAQRFLIVVLVHGLDSCALTVSCSFENSTVVTDNTTGATAFSGQRLPIICENYEKRRYASASRRYKQYLHTA